MSGTALADRARVLAKWPNARIEEDQFEGGIYVMSGSVCLSTLRNNADEAWREAAEGMETAGRRAV